MCSKYFPLKLSVIFSPLIILLYLLTRFVKLSVERAPFLCERLKINMLPTIGLVVEGKTKDFIKGWCSWLESGVFTGCVAGFDELGGSDDFSTELLEWRLGSGGVIDYSGNILEPPQPQSQKKQVSFHSKKTIRDSAVDSSDSD